MATSHLPINVIDTDKVEHFYQRALERNQLGVNHWTRICIGQRIRTSSSLSLKIPQNKVDGRLQDPPELRGPTIEILGLGEQEAAGDVVFSSAGRFIDSRCSMKTCPV